MTPILEYGSLLPVPGKIRSPFWWFLLGPVTCILLLLALGRRWEAPLPENHVPHDLTLREADAMDGDHRP